MVNKLRDKDIEIFHETIKFILYEQTLLVIFDTVTNDPTRYYVL